MDRPSFIFDLDGTLLDTLADLASACNTILASRGWPVRPVDSYRLMVGNGFAKLVERALPDGMAAALPAEELAQLMAQGKRTYTEHLMDATLPYEGMVEAVERLAALGCPLGVLSNKPEPMTCRLVEHFFPGRFAAVHGGRPGMPLKPDPQAVHALMEEMGPNPAGFLYVGDSNVDMMTARNAGLPGIGAAWGFRGEAELAAAGAARIVRHPAELVALASDPALRAR